MATIKIKDELKEFAEHEAAKHGLSTAAEYIEELLSAVRGRSNGGASSGVPDYSAIFGAARGCFGTVDDIDEAVRRERDSWLR